MPESNPEQTQAVEHGDGPLLVVAGPGAGKTRVITERIVRLLQRPPAEGPRLQPENILALTFTEKAAGEMKQRVARALPAMETSPVISTFHAFCYQALRERHEDRLLLDKTDVWIFLRRRMAQLGLESYQKLAEPGAFLHDLNEFFSRCQDELIEPEGFAAYVRGRETAFLEAGKRGGGDVAAGNSHAAGAEEVARLKELACVFANSQRMIAESGASSLGSLVSETVSLWRRDAAVLDQARSRFRAILVDEFQDTNYAQVELLKLLVPPPYAITAVGDDDQAIYRFRGASHGAFAMFSRAFPGHRIVYLKQNYRSTQRIVRAASAVIAHNDRYAEKPPLVTSNPEGAPVFLIKAKNTESEALWIADEIERLVKKGASYGDMAVLYRAHGYREDLMQELRHRGVPLSIRGLSILSTTTLRDLCAYLRLIHSPLENISLTRVLLAPRWLFPEMLSQRLRDRAANNRCSFYEAIQAESRAAPDDLSRTAWSELEQLIKMFRRLARSLPMTALVQKLEKRLGWTRSQREPDHARLEAFHKFLAAWEEKSETRQLAEFIEYFNYFIEAGGKIEAPQPAGNAVQMMTVHAAKGLEFPIVFILGVSARRFPSTERKPVIDFPPELRKGPAPPRDIHLQEERRLFFVGITRAEQRLYISTVSKTARLESAFVQELTSDAAFRGRDLELVEPRDSDGAASGPLDSAKQFGETADQTGETQGWLFADAAPSDGGIHASIAVWALQSAGAESNGVLRLSATAIEDYLACPLKYKFQHVLKIPAGPQAALTFGNLMHASARHYIELRRRGATPTVGQVRQFYLDHWKSAGFDDEYQEQTYRQAGLEQLAGFVEKQNASDMDARKVDLERSFQFNLDDVTVDGRIDQVNPLNPLAQGRASELSAVELVDYKTGRPRTAKDAEKSLQLSVYALAAQKALGLKAARLTLYNFTNNEAVSSVRTPASLDRASEVIREAASGIRAKQFRATPGFLCRWCNYVAICPAHED